MSIKLIKSSLLYNTQNSEKKEAAHVINIGTDETLKGFSGALVDKTFNDSQNLLNEIASTYAKSAYDNEQRFIITVWLTHNRSTQYFMRHVDLMNDSTKEFDASKIEMNKSVRELLNRLLQATDLDLLSLEF